jgi:GTP-binding protein
MDVPAVDLTPLFDTVVKHVPPPPSFADGPFQMLVSTIDYSPYLGRLAIGRVERGTVHVGDQVTLLPVDESAKPVLSKVTKLYGFEALDRIEIESAGAGEIVSMAGLDGVEIGLTLTDPEHQDRLEGIAVEEPTISVDFLVNNSPFSCTLKRPARTLAAMPSMTAAGSRVPSSSASTCREKASTFTDT